MSMTLHVYVGPYAECGGADRTWGDIIGEVESDLTVAFDEDVGDGLVRWIPNREFKDSESFDRFSANKPFIIDGNVGNYRDAFEDKFHDAIEVLRKHYGSVKVRYGALPYTN